MYNRAILVGRLTADPELRQTPNGTYVTSFSLAVSRQFSDKATGERQTDFINIVAWRQNAEFISKYFKKGNMIGLEGVIQSRNYTDKDGNKRTAVDVVVDRAFFVESKSSSNNNQSYGSSNASLSGYAPPPMPSQNFQIPPPFDNFGATDADDDLPF